MLQRGLITEQDSKKIDTMMLEKYRPLLAGVWFAVVDKVTVFSDDDVRFAFRDGTGIRA